ncbi:hypothetical protein [Bradyrhizobium sp. USDA 3256]
MSESLGIDPESQRRPAPSAYACCDDVSVPLSCPTRQADSSQYLDRHQYSFWLASVELTRAAFDCKEEASMYFVAAVLAVLSGLFYAAGHHQIGSLGATMCQYGGIFCDSPVLVLVGAGFAAAWGMLVSVR